MLDQPTVRWRLRRSRRRSVSIRHRSAATWVLLAVSLCAGLERQSERSVTAFQSPPGALIIRSRLFRHRLFDTRKSRIRLFDSEPSTLQDGAFSIIRGTTTVVNGKSGHGPAVNGVEANVDATAEYSSSTMDGSDQVQDIPKPTVNGGYTHTTASRAKISAANKGKTPWNKGKSRSDETRARIAAGVRARNRQRFLEMLQEIGLTEEEHERQRKEERRRKDAERRKRRTDNGGYRPTDETRSKISQALKTKWASGKMKKRSIDPAKVRRGFTHSEETRARISASLRKRWADDEGYRENMMKKSTASNSKEHVQKRISNSLKKRWQDPDFRDNMLIKISQRQQRSQNGMSHRERISVAMKAKWQDEEYRNKTLAAIQQRQATLAALRPSKPLPPVKKEAIQPRQKTTSKTRGVDGLHLVQPVKPKQNKMVKKRKKKTNSVLIEDGTRRVLKKKAPIQKRVVDDMEDDDDDDELKSKAEKASLAAEPDGSINRLREERRDLYDLLYGDDAGSVATHLGDENLDTFDPYGLDDF